MSSFVNIIFIIEVCVIFEQTVCLIELPHVEDNDILKTEAVIRNITNRLFLTFKINKAKDKQRLKEYSIIHNYLVSITLQDYNNLKEIAKLTRVTVDNATENFITELNALLNEDYRSDENNLETIDDNTIKHIKMFLDRLQSLKEIYGVNHRLNDINSDVIKLLYDDYNDVNDSGQLEPNVDADNSTLLDENDFWVPEYSGRRIYRGQRTKIRRFPFMATILFFNKFQCAGSIIKSDLIITASSCLQLAWNNRFFRENPAFLSVRIGSNFYNGGGEVIPITEIYFHPNYNPKNLKHNLCILRLRRKIFFKKAAKRVKKIDFDRSPYMLSEMTDGITIVGWGAKGINNIVMDPWQNKISFAVLDFYPLKECQEIYSREYVTKRHFCAGFMSKGGGACNRDVGGPGISHGILMGVISFGSPVCGAPDAPTVFTKLGYYTDWIEEIMEQEVPSARIKTTLRTTRNVYDVPTANTETTTFKLEPLVPGKSKTISIWDTEKESFTQFLKTIFNSQELMEYHDVIYEDKTEDKLVARDDPVAKETVTTPSTVIITQSDAVEYLTTLPEFTENIYPQKYTQLDELLENEPKNQDIQEISDEEESKKKHFTKKHTKVKHTRENKHSKSHKKDVSDSDLLHLIETIDIKETPITLPDVVSDRKVNDDKMSKKKKDDDSVLTLLYLSDSEKKGDNEVEGLTIPAGFTDFTYRNNKTDSKELYDFISKDELYDILNEAIESEIQSQNKTTA